MSCTRMVGTIRLEEENRMGAAGTESGAYTKSLVTNDFVFLPGTSASMRALEEAIKNVAATGVPVLIVGENGSGKHAVARRIHQLSSRAEEPIHELVCGGLCADFFSPGQGGLGRLAASTVLLTEVGDLSSSSQSKLLHCLSELKQNFDGGMPRILASTRRNLDQEVRNSGFREDLYYLISGMCLRIPPLRHRKSDIPLLVDHFLEKYSTLLDRPKPTLTASTLRFLCEYSWPANVRELEDVAKTIAAIGDEHVALSAMKSALLGGRRRNGDPEPLSLKETGRAASRQAERELIVRVLSRTRWNRKRAAMELRISYKALLYKLKQFGVDEYTDPNSREE